MGRLTDLCKAFGSMQVSRNGKTVKWIYDYANDKPRMEKEMTKEEIRESERAKWMKVASNSKF